MTENKPLIVFINPEMRDRAGIICANGDLINVAELIDAFTNILDGQEDYDIENMTGVGMEKATRYREMFHQLMSK